MRGLLLQKPHELEKPVYQEQPPKVNTTVLSIKKGQPRKKRLAISQSKSPIERLNFEIEVDETEQFFAEAEYSLHGRTETRERHIYDYVKGTKPRAPTPIDG